MPDKIRHPYADAMAVALTLKEQLAPFCERIEIAGSLRRKRPTVGDVELLFVPRFEDRQADMFTTEPCDLAAEEINAMLARGDVSKRPSAIGAATWGPKNKLAIHRGGIAVDFFTTTIENWWVSLVIRTGGKETNLALTTGAQAKICTLHAYGSGISDRHGKTTPATSEAHVFALCGVPYREPEGRP